jgi:flagellar hook-length control protein FliK
VDAQKPATPPLSVYDHFVGYSMAENASASLANGGVDNAAANAPGINDASAAAPTTVAFQAALAVAQSAANGAAANTANATPTVARAETAAPAAVSAVAASTSSEAQSGLGEMGLGQSSLSENGNVQTPNGRPTQAPAQTATPAQVFDQIKVKISRATKAGLDQVSIQLKPEALGRVDIKLEVATDGKVHATVTVDKQDTLTMLQNDSRGLEQALNDAGLRTDANSLQFNLRGDGNNNAPTGSTADYGTQAATTANDDSLDTTPIFDYARAASQRGGVDTYA